MKNAELESRVRNIFASAGKLKAADKSVIQKVIQLLNKGQLRVAENAQGKWITHEWLKMAVLLYFRIQTNKSITSGPFSYFDKIPVKKWTAKDGVRVVPQALVRHGAFIEAGAVLMPSYVNIGAYVGAGTMVDTWATVGSCAQIGKNVHLSGGVGIGGVLEPLQAQPVIIEDDVFVGSRAIIVEGVRVGQGAVIGAGVVLTASTRILDVRSGVEKQSSGEVPERCVVIPGVRNKKFPAGEYGVPCALIIGERSESTDKKTSLNQVLREHDISV